MNKNIYEQIFQKSINTALKYATQVTDFKEAAMIYSNIALAIANSGKLNNSVSNVEIHEEVKEDVMTNNENVQVSDTPVQEEQEQKQETTAPSEPKVDQIVLDSVKLTDANLPNEWTQEAIEYLKEHTTFINQCQQKYGFDAVNEALSDFSTGTVKTLNEIKPIMVPPFRVFLEAHFAD